MPAKGSRKGRKIGRNKVKCAAYKAAGRHRINKLRKLKKHLGEHPTDECAQTAIQLVRL